MARFRKKPVIVDAVRIKHKVTVTVAKGNTWQGKTSEIKLRANPGDWLITGVAGDRAVVTDDVFRATHDPVNGEAEKMMEGE